MLLCGAVHQVAHLIEIGADAIDIAATGLVQNRVADVTGIKRRVAEEPVVAIRVQAEPVQEIGRAKELVPIGIRAVGSTRCGTGCYAKQVIQSIKQAVVHVAEFIELRVHRNQIRAIGIGGWNKIAVVAGRQWIVTAAAVLVGER